MMWESQTFLCMLLSSVSMRKLEALRRTRTQRTQAFHILVVPSFRFWCEKYDLLLRVLKNGFSLIDSFVYQRVYKVLFESISLFWKYSDKLKGFQKPGICHFDIKSFQSPIIIKETAFPTIKVEVNKPELKRTYLRFKVPDQRYAMTYIDVLGN